MTTVSIYQIQRWICQVATIRRYGHSYGVQNDSTRRQRSFRAKDVIKSGGEWISSIELENSIMAHDAVEEATVIGVSHERWQERPIAFIVASEGSDEATIEAEVLSMLRESYPKWWLPDDVAFIDEVPKTATGTFSKKDLREQYTDASMFEGKPPAEAAPED